MQKKYSFQSFLFKTNYKKIKLVEFYKITDISNIRDYEVAYDIVDYIEGYVRKVQLSKLDSYIDDEYDWEQFYKKIDGVDKLIIVDDRNYINNSIYCLYALNVLRAYITLFQERNITCEIVRMNESCV